MFHGYVKLPKDMFYDGGFSTPLKPGQQVFLSFVDHKLICHLKVSSSPTARPVGWPCRWRRCSLVTKHCWWFCVKTQGYGDRSKVKVDRTTFDFCWSKNPICREPCHAHHLFKATLWHFRVVNSYSQAKLLCVSDLPGRHQTYRGLFPPWTLDKLVGLEHLSCFHEVGNFI